MHHRPSRLFVNSLFDSSLLEEVEQDWSLLMEKAGCLGAGRFTVSPSSILIIIDMVGDHLGHVVHIRDQYLGTSQTDLQCKYLVGSRPLNPTACHRSTISMPMTVNKHWYEVKNYQSIGY